jgi:small-conductance mechanosensitive channel
MTQYGAWASYSGSAKIVLALVLLAAAGGVTYAATRLPRPVRPARPGEAATTFMFVAWGFAIVAFAACVTTYLQAAKREHVFHAPPVDPITPVTLSCVGVIFVIILLISARSLGWGCARKRCHRRPGRADDRSAFSSAEPRPGRPIGHLAGTASSLTATTLDTYGHIWTDRDESTSAAVDAVITARTEPGRNSGDAIKQRRRSGLV